MADAGFFKTTTFGGFDKKSVLTYIDTLSQQFRAAEEEYTEKLNSYAQAQDSQVAHIKKLEENLALANEQVSQLQKQLDEQRELASQAQEMISGLDSQNKELHKKLSDNDREMQIQLERCRQLQFKAESLDYKSKKYDEISNQIGDAIIEARQSADKIIETANEQADEITQKAKDYMKNFYSELSSFNSDATRLRKSIEEILFVLNDRIDVMQEVVKQVEKRYTPESAAQQGSLPEQDQLFSQPEDKAGFFAGSSHEV